MSSIQHGEVKSSYFWDDGSGINGDTGAPASGEPMQKGLFSSPSWPLGTEGYVEYKGKKADFFIGDRGPGDPAASCDVLLDMDGKTFAELTGESFDSESLTVSGGEGHLEDVTYHITEWGDGAGKEGAPHPMGAEDTPCTDAVSKEPTKEQEQQEQKEQKEQEQKKEKEQQKQERKDQEAAEKKEVAKDQQELKDDSAASRADAMEDRLDGAAAPAGSGGSGGSGGSESGALQDVAHVANDVPMASGGLTMLLVSALAGAAYLAKRRRTMAERISGRHRRPSLLGRFDPRTEAETA